MATQDAGHHLQQQQQQQHDAEPLSDARADDRVTVNHVEAPRPLSVCPL